MYTVQTSPRVGRLVTTATALVLLFCSAGQSRFGGKVSDVIDHLRSTSLSAREQDQMRRSYYEDLIHVERYNSNLAVTYHATQTGWGGFSHTPMAREVSDVREYDLRPFAQGRFKGALLSVNRWGMRDHDYERAHAPGTYRLALLGSSHVMGSGVDDGATFESLVEARLNERRGGEANARYELLNFAVAGYRPYYHPVHLERLGVFDFAPDGLILFGQIGDFDMARNGLEKGIRRGRDFDDPELRAIVARSGLTAQSTQSELAQRLEPLAREVIAWSYRRIVMACREHGARPVWVYLPEPSETSRPGLLAWFKQTAREAGFALLDMSGVYDSVPETTIWIAEWDNHPNARGHELLARRFYSELSRNEAVTQLGMFVPPGSNQTTSYGE